MFAIGQFVIKQPYILAPMAGVSQMPFRRLAIKHGAGLAPTELVSAKGLFYDSVRTKSYLTHDASVEKPFCVQLFGGEEEAMANAAEKAGAMGAQIIDINMGCPVKKVTKTNAGSALLCDPKRAQAIVKAMIKSVLGKIPITAKIRTGWDQFQLNYIDVGKALEDAGIAAIAMHARTRAQGYSGKADWTHIGELKQALSIPVIGNGDVLNHKQAKRMKQETGCDAVMIGRAALGNPWIFRELTTGHAYVPSALERFSVVIAHLAEHLDLHRLVSDQCGQPFNEALALASFRSHFIWYSKGLRNSAQFRQEIVTTNEMARTKELVEAFFMSAEHAEGTIPCDEGINYAQAFG